MLSTAECMEWLYTHPCPNQVLGGNCWVDEAPTKCM